MAISERIALITIILTGSIFVGVGHSVADDIQGAELIFKRSELICVVEHAQAYRDSDRPVVVVPFYKCPKQPDLDDELIALSGTNMLPKIKLNGSTEAPQPVEVWTFAKPEFECFLLAARQILTSEAGDPLTYDRASCAQ